MMAHGFERVKALVSGGMDPLDLRSGIGKRAALWLVLENC